MKIANQRSPWSWGWPGTRVTEGAAVCILSVITSMRDCASPCESVNDDSSCATCNTESEICIDYWNIPVSDRQKRTKAALSVVIGWAGCVGSHCWEVKWEIQPYSVEDKYSRRNFDQAQYYGTLMATTTEPQDRSSMTYVCLKVVWGCLFEIEQKAENTYDSLYAVWLGILIGCFIMDSSLSPAGSSSSPQTIICTPELHREITKITRAKKRQKRPTLNSYSRPKPSGLKQRQHMEYQVYGDGSMSYARRYVQPPENAQPALQPHPPAHLELNADVEFTEYSPDLSSWGADDDAAHPRRRRAMGVSH